MRVTKAQVQANRAHIVETAAYAFREHGYDGISVADLMGASGFTHGGFYKHFGSKADLMGEAATCGIAQMIALSSGGEISELVKQYLSRQHRDDRAAGCTMAALSGDAARQPEAVRACFASGIDNWLAALSPVEALANSEQTRATRIKHLDTLAHAIGAIVMSRACPDSSVLADEILTVCRDSILASLAKPTPPHGSDSPEQHLSVKANTFSAEETGIDLEITLKPQSADGSRVEALVTDATPKTPK